MEFIVMVVILPHNTQQSDRKFLICDDYTFYVLT